jgi:hypothetical protein
MEWIIFTLFFALPPDSALRIAVHKRRLLHAQAQTLKRKVVVIIDTFGFFAMDIKPPVNLD